MEIKTLILKKSKKKQTLLFTLGDEISWNDPKQLWFSSFRPSKHFDNTHTWFWTWFLHLAWDDLRNSNSKLSQKMDLWNYRARTKTLKSENRGSPSAMRRWCELGHKNGMEFRVNMLPHVTMEEVSPIVSRFIEHIATQEDNDAPS